MDIEKILKTLKSIELYDAEKESYSMNAPDPHYAEMFNESIKEAIFYLETIQHDIKEEQQPYDIDVIDNHGSHHLCVRKIEISHLKEVEDIEQLLFNLPNNVILRLKEEIIESKDPSYLSLLKYFDQKFDLKPI